MSAPKLEMHYYLSKESHSMNAVIRNKCEAELLGLIAEAANTLGVRIELESQAFKEGGLKEIWKALGDNNNQITILLVIITILLSRIPVDDPEKEALDEELTKLQIEEKKLQIKKLRSEMNKAEPGDDLTENAVNTLSKNPKIVVRRSNFYKHLSTYPKVESVGVTPFSINQQPLRYEKQVQRRSFGKFILRTHAIKPVVIDDAVIEIVSPVLKEGNYRWKGIFQDEPLSFNMLDHEFQGLVLREEVTFQHGTYIECVLNQHRKLDEVGEVLVTGYTVTTVIRKFDDRQSIETNRGRSYKHSKKLKESQNDMFEGN